MSGLECTFSEYGNEREEYQGPIILRLLRKVEELVPGSVYH